MVNLSCFSGEVHLIFRDRPVIGLELTKKVRLVGQEAPETDLSLHPLASLCHSGTGSHACTILTEPSFKLQ